MRPGREALALAAAAGAGIQVGAAIAASRAVVAETGPWSLTFLRYGIALLCFLPLLALHRVPPRVAPRDLLAIAVLGILQMGGVVTLLNLGLRTTTASRASLLFTTFPLLTMLVAAALGREAVTWPKALGILVTLTGVAAILGEALGTAGQGGEALGLVLVLAAALLGAVCSVLFGPYLARYPIRWVTAIAMLASTLALTPGMLAEATYPGWASLGPRIWALVAGIGLSSAVGFLLWFTALRLSTPTRVTVFLALSPATSCLLGISLLGEPLTPIVLWGLAGVAAGLVIATRRGPEPAAAS